MKIHTIKVGSIATNCYIVEDQKSKAALIIDPGDQPEDIIQLVTLHQLRPLFVVNTHGHFDHVTGNMKIKEKYNIPVYNHNKDEFLIKMSIPFAADKNLAEGDNLQVGSISFEVIHTPGHSPGCICLYSKEEKVLFSGDTLFFGTYGRTDFPYGSEEQIITSLQKLFKLPPETKVYPGHGKPTIIKNEREMLG